MSFYAGGTTTAISTVYGVTDLGEQARVTWSDGMVHAVRVTQHGFLYTREGDFSVQRVVCAPSPSTPKRWDEIGQTALEAHERAAAPVSERHESLYQ